MASRTPAVVDRILWTALLGAATGMAALAAARLAAWAWTQLRDQPPPRPYGLLSGLARRAGEGALRGFGA